MRRFKTIERHAVAASPPLTGNRGTLKLFFIHRQFLLSADPQAVRWKESVGIDHLFAALNGRTTLSRDQTDQLIALLHHDTIVASYTIFDSTAVASLITDTNPGEIDGVAVTTNDGMETGGGNVDTAAAISSLAQALSLYREGMTLPDQFVNTTTMMGQAFLGTMNKLLHSDAATQDHIAQVMSNLTNIPAWKISGVMQRTITDVRAWNVAPQTPTPEQAKQQLVDLWKVAGYGGIFGLMGPFQLGVQSMHLSKANYSGSDSFLQVRFDASLGENKQMDHANVYLIVDGKKDTAPLTPEIRDTLYVDIPMHTILSRLASRSTAHIQIAVQVKATDGTVFTVENGLGKVSDGVIVENNEHKPNAEILNYLSTSVFPTLQPKYADDGKTIIEWVSPETGQGGTCKVWVQNALMSGAFIEKIPEIPSNSKDSKSEWNVIPDSHA